MGAWLADSISSDTGFPTHRQPCPLYWNPSSILLANSIQKKKKNPTEERTMIITKRMKEPTSQSSPWRLPLPQPCPELTAQQSCFALRTLAQQGPSSSPNLEASRSVHISTHTGLTLAQAETWHGPLAGLQRLWPLLSILPLISWRHPGTKAAGTRVWGAEGTAMEEFRESHAGWEINTKRLESLAALLPSDGMGRVPAGVEGGR